MVQVQQPLGGGDPAVGDLLQLAQIDRLVEKPAVQQGAVLQARLGDGLVEAPREGMTAGGIFPAIVGTAMLTLLMSIIGVPVGTFRAST